MDLPQWTSMNSYVILEVFQNKKNFFAEVNKKKFRSGRFYRVDWKRGNKHYFNFGLTVKSYFLKCPISVYIFYLLFILISSWICIKYLTLDIKLQTINQFSTTIKYLTPDIKLQTINKFSTTIKYLTPDIKLQTINTFSTTNTGVKKYEKD